MGMAKGVKKGTNGEPSPCLEWRNDGVFGKSYASVWYSA